jgi:hypothetical protein
MTGLQVLISKMDSDDAEAFDELRSMKSFEVRVEVVVAGASVVVGGEALDGIHRD